MPLFEGEYHTAKEFRFHQGALSSGTKDIARFLVIEDRGQQYGEQGFLQVQIQRENDNSKSLQTTNKGMSMVPCILDIVSTLFFCASILTLRSFFSSDLLLNGLYLTLEPRLSTVIKLPNMDNSLLAYSLKASRPGCEGKTKKNFKDLVPFVI